MQAFRIYQLKPVHGAWPVAVLVVNITLGKTSLMALTARKYDEADKNIKNGNRFKGLFLPAYVGNVVLEMKARSQPACEGLA